MMRMALRLAKISNLFLNFFYRTDNSFTRLYNVGGCRSEPVLKRLSERFSITNRETQDYTAQNRSRQKIFL